MLQTNLKRKLLATFLSFGAMFSAHAFTVSSDAVKPGHALPHAQVFNGFGCEGDNHSPALSWQNAPEGTKSFAVTLYDPDAPTGSGFWHWIVVDIPADTSELSENIAAQLPEPMRQITNDYGFSGFGGACPPAGDNPHRYQLSVHALDVDKIDLPEDASPAVVRFMIHAHQLAVATTTGYYQR
ncbi:YbhB/YbcL family Raf kinase inhibitor-like protein [Cardiobacteriaceae bacterium TAE3-ERU3]|nr:YbhB/YbcL family Raf kinase inhibitor-like protein [Cardiobacteriaceae bacterium TAE3-ERU3]